ALASWLSRVPTVRAELDLDPRALGLVLLGLAAGSTLSLPGAGAVVSRLGTGPTVRLTGMIVVAGLVVVALGYSTGPVTVAIGLFLVGFGSGVWDVAMNVQGARVEVELGRSLMPRLHAGFSVGTVGGALLGAGAIAIGLSVRTHLLIIAAVVLVVVVVAASRFRPDERVERGSSGAGLLRAWTEPRTLLVGLFVLAMAFSEGTGNDWIAVATIDGYGVSSAQGALVFAVFVSAMTVGRLAGTGLLDRLPRVTVLRGSGLVALVGVVVLAFSTAYPWALVGAVAWGLGTALGFPLGMTAAAEDPVRAAARVSVVATVGYLAFLAGPPLIGFLGQETGVQRAVSVAAGLLAVAVLVAPALAPRGCRTGWPRLCGRLPRRVSTTACRRAASWPRASPSSAPSSPSPPSRPDPPR
ncbi:MAG: MFS transporter, partial [Geodermatophilaceae bacterium]|nr:MFS transporter [Geodermatophilaceae bacterium]